MVIMVVGGGGGLLQNKVTVRDTYTCVTLVTFRSSQVQDPF